MTGLVLLPRKRNRTNVLVLRPLDDVKNCIALFRDCCSRIHSDRAQCNYRGLPPVAAARRTPKANVAGFHDTDPPKRGTGEQVLKRTGPDPHRTLASKNKKKPPTIGWPGVRHLTGASAGQRSQQNTTPTQKGPRQTATARSTTRRASGRKLIGQTRSSVGPEQAASPPVRHPLDRTSIGAEPFPPEWASAMQPPSFPAYAARIHRSETTVPTRSRDPPISTTTGREQK